MNAPANLINAGLIDPATGYDRPGALRIEGGRIADVHRGGHLLGTWRPDDTFQRYGFGKSMLFNCSAMPFVTFLIALAMGGHTKILLISVALLAFGAVPVFGPAKLD